MVCSHCRCAGHTYRRCPTMGEEDKKAKAKELSDKKLAFEARRVARIARDLEYQKTIQKKEKELVEYEVVNTTNHEIVLYWTNALILAGPIILKRFSYLKPHSGGGISCVKGQHRIIGIPFLEVCENDSPNAKEVVHCPSPNENQYVTVIDMILKEFEGTTIIIDCVYKPVKKEIDQWKECALKSKYLLDQVIKLGGMKYENLEPILDMVQDITVPSSCSEVDKEMAGIPSTLTNIT